MNKPSLLLLLITTSLLSYAQDQPLSIFDHLINKTWISEGKWGDGSLFKQETNFEYGLNMSIVIVQSKGFTNQEQSEYGDRNFGIRAYDAENDKIVFTEYDIFGGITKGEVIKKGIQLIYKYEYGGSILADTWEYVNDSTYSFMVCSYENDRQGQVYLSTQFRLANTSAD